MGWFKNTIGKLFGSKKEETAKKEVITTETDSTANQYLYEAGELTSYDCIAKAKELGLDMREIDTKMNSMKNKDFIKWFQETHLTE